jgi:Beta-lactamase enzyme family
MVGAFAVALTVGMLAAFIPTRPTGPDRAVRPPRSLEAAPSSDPVDTHPAPPERAVVPPSATSVRADPDPFDPASARYVKARAGTTLAAVFNVATGRVWTLGQGSPQAEASVVKLDILETLLYQAQTRDQDLSTGVRSLARRMMEDSDNDAATGLWDMAGGGSAIKSYNDAAGLLNTSPSLCVQCSGFPWPGWGLSTTTPTDQLTLLRQLILPGSLLTPANRHYALDLMENVDPAQRWGVSGGVPLEATVALKDGWLPLNGQETDWQIDSVGWISGLGRNYLMAVLSTGNPTEQYGIDTIDDLAGVIWNAMG